MKSRLRRLLMFVILAAAVGAVVYALMPQPVSVDVAAVTRGALVVTVDEDGKTRIKERYVVAAPLGGQLLRIDLDPGDPVESGTTLLTAIQPIDPALLDVRSRAEAQARVRAAEAALKQAEPRVETARIALEFAESQWGRTRDLYNRDTISREEYENAELLYRSRGEEFRAARFAEEIARYELELARAALVRSQPANSSSGNGSEVDAGQFEIHSPITGRVLRVMQESATVVTPGTALIELGDPADLEVEIDVLSSDAVRVQPGAKVYLEQWGGDEPLLGQVRLIEPAGFTKISALGVEEQRVWVIVDFDESQPQAGALGDGYRVEARIVVYESDDAVKVPTSALFRYRGDWAAFVLERGRAVLRTVEIGRRNDLEAEVHAGLSEGEQVVVHPSDRVVDGVRVTVRPES